MGTTVVDELGRMCDWEEADGVGCRALWSRTMRWRGVYFYPYGSLSRADM